MQQEGCLSDQVSYIILEDNLNNSTQKDTTDKFPTIPSPACVCVNVAACSRIDLVRVCVSDLSACPCACEGARFVFCVNEGGAFGGWWWGWDIKPPKSKKMLTAI